MVAETELKMALNWRVRVVDRMRFSADDDRILVECLEWIGPISPLRFSQKTETFQQRHFDGVDFRPQIGMEFVMTWNVFSPPFPEGDDEFFAFLEEHRDIVVTEISELVITKTISGHRG